MHPTSYVPDIVRAKRLTRAICCYCKEKIKGDELCLRYVHGRISVAGGEMHSEYRMLWKRKAHLLCWLSECEMIPGDKQLREARKLKFMKQV
jgi:hypothetical protein